MIHTKPRAGKKKQCDHVTLTGIISACSLLYAIVKAVSLRVHSFIMLMPLWGGGGVSVGAFSCHLVGNHVSFPREL